MASEISKRFEPGVTLENGRERERASAGAVDCSALNPSLSDSNPKAVKRRSSGAARGVPNCAPTAQATGPAWAQRSGLRVPG